MRTTTWVTGIRRVWSVDAILTPQPVMCPGGASRGNRSQARVRRFASCAPYSQTCGSAALSVSVHWRRGLCRDVRDAPGPGESASTATARCLTSPASSSGLDHCRVRRCGGCWARPRVGRPEQCPCGAGAGRARPPRAVCRAGRAGAGRPRRAVRFGAGRRRRLPSACAEVRNRVAAGVRTQHPEIELARWAAAHLSEQERGGRPCSPRAGTAYSTSGTSASTHAPSARASGTCASATLRRHHALVGRVRGRCRSARPDDYRSGACFGPGLSSVSGRPQVGCPRGGRERALRGVSHQLDALPLPDSVTSNAQAA